MAQFDEVFAKVNARLNAAMAAIADCPTCPAKVAVAVATAEDAAIDQEARAQDDARANALATMFSGLTTQLSAVVGAQSGSTGASGGTGDTGGESGGTGDTGGDTGGTGGTGGEGDPEE